MGQWYKDWLQIDCWDLLESSTWLYFDYKVFNTLKILPHTSLHKFSFFEWPLRLKRSQNQLLCSTHLLWVVLHKIRILHTASTMTDQPLTQAQNNYFFKELKIVILETKLITIFKKLFFSVFFFLCTSKEKIFSIYENNF